MKKLLYSLLLGSVPLLLMLQVLQAYRYISATEEIAHLQRLQEDGVETNRRLVAGIAVFDSPERVYGVASESLGLEPAEPERVMQVRFPETDEGNQ